MDVWAGSLRMAETYGVIKTFQMITIKICTDMSTFYQSSANLKLALEWMYDISNWFAIDYTWWRHQMETYFALLAICAGNSPVPGDFPAQRPVTRSVYIFFDLRPNTR